MLFTAILTLSFIATPNAISFLDTGTTSYPECTDFSDPQNIYWGTNTRNGCSPKPEQSVIQLKDNEDYAVVSDCISEPFNITRLNYRNSFDAATYDQNRTLTIQVDFVDQLEGDVTYLLNIQETQFDDDTMTIEYQYKVGTLNDCDVNVIGFSDCAAYNLINSINISENTTTNELCVYAELYDELPLAVTLSNSNVELSSVGFIVTMFVVLLVGTLFWRVYVK